MCSRSASAPASTLPQPWVISSLPVPVSTVPPSMATVSLPAPVISTSVDEPLPRLSITSSPEPVRSSSRSRPESSWPSTVCTLPGVLAQATASVAADQSA